MAIHPQKYIVTHLLVCPLSPDLTDAAAALAAELGLPFAAQASDDTSHILMQEPERVTLHTLGKHAPGPVYVDFVQGAAAWRRQHGGGRGQLLPKAVGLKGETLPKVVDSTAGLGRDGFVLASLGCSVTLLERSPLAFALLRDGIRRAALDPQVASIAQRMTLIHADATQYLQSLAADNCPDVVVVDPMFPDRGKAALAKKEMQAFQALIGDDLDAPALLQAAIACAKKRVVVKRPRLGAVIDGPKPNLQMAGQSTRFDVYFRL